MKQGQLPKSWKDVTVPQLIEIETIKHDSSIDKEPYPYITRGIYLLSVFTKKPFSYYESEISVTELKLLIASLDFLNEYPSEKAVNKFKCGGYTWRVKHKINSLKASQLIDHCEYTKDDKKILSNCSKLLALYCTPYKFFRKVEMTDEEKSKILLNAPINVIYPLTVFFCKVYNSFLENIPVSLNKEMQKLMKEAKELQTAH